MKPKSANTLSAPHNILKQLKNNNRTDDVLFELINKNDQLKSIANNIQNGKLLKYPSLYKTSSNQPLNRTVEHVYSKNEIRMLVEQNLIDEFQHPSIIEAVTDYFYKLHMDF